MIILEKTAIKNETGRVHAEIEVNPEDRTAVIYFLGYQSYDDIRNVYAKALESIKQQGIPINRLLLDSTEMKGPFRYDGHWIADEYVRPFTRLGVRHIALVVTARIFSELKNQEIVVGEMPARFFTNVSYARAWLATLH